MLSYPSPQSRPLRLIPLGAGHSRAPAHVADTTQRKCGRQCLRSENVLSSLRLLFGKPDAIEFDFWQAGIGSLGVFGAVSAGSSF